MLDTLASGFENPLQRYIIKGLIFVEMAFHKKIKSLDEVLRLYGVRYEEMGLALLTSFKMPEAVKEDLAFVLDKLDYKSTEGAIREYVISPILKEAWKRYADDFLLWVEKAISYKKEFVGVPDYIISRRSAMGKIFFESPHVAVVEAKKDDFVGGWTQCALEMYAIQKINDTDLSAVYGIVTNGDTWEIGALENSVFTKYTDVFILKNIDELYNALCTIFEKCALPK